jgi:hypothetical protein
MKHSESFVMMSSSSFTIENNDPDTMARAWIELDQLLKALHLVDGTQSDTQHDQGTIISQRSEDHLSKILLDLADVLDRILTTDPRESIVAAWEKVANATRDIPAFRSSFGLQRRPSAEENEEQLQSTTRPDCVLEAARRGLLACKSAQTDGLAKQVLRVIANCCADNNINRNLVIGRSGISLMKHFAADRKHLEILTHALYNVCIDYDVIFTKADGSQLTHTEMNEPGSNAQPASISVAEEELGRYDDELDISSLEMFLDLTEHVEDHVHETLACLIEMASRPSLFGLELILGTSDPVMLRQRIKNLFQALSRESHLYSTDEETQDSLCQTYLHLASQKLVQVFLSESWDHLITFISIPKNHNSELSEANPINMAVMKLAYTISSLPNYTEHITPDFFHTMVPLVRSKDINSPRVASLVLITNALTTLEDVREFHRVHQLQSDLVKIIISSTDTMTLSPALNLCTRIALIPEGSRDLFQAQVLDAILHILTNDRQQSGQLEIVQEALALTRLLIKSQPEHASNLVAEKAELYHNILTLAPISIDAKSKLEAGRLVVEILRTLLSTSSLCSDSNPTPTSTEAIPALSSPLAIKAIIFLVTETPAPTRAEGLFGLGLLSTLPSPHIKTTITQTLSQESEKLSKILSEIASSNENDERENENENDESQDHDAQGHKHASPSTKADRENLKFLLSQLLQSSSSNGALSSMEPDQETGFQSNTVHQAGELSTFPALPEKKDESLIAVDMEMKTNSKTKSKSDPELNPDTTEAEPDQILDNFTQTLRGIAVKLDLNLTN